MLEVRKNTFARSYENTFFREFARELSKRFEAKGIEGLLLGSPFCEVEERLQIDALLITSNVICIIDFKNYSHLIQLPDHANFKQGIWLDQEGNRIKGGSSINPFVQLSQQKSRFETIFKRYISQNIMPTDSINTRHTEKIVCFQNPVVIRGEVPPALTNFHITDKAHFAETILDVIDVKNQTSLSRKSFDAFKDIFLAAAYEIEDLTIEQVSVNISDNKYDTEQSHLYDDQQAAMNVLSEFLNDEDQKVFVLQGTLNSGKSHLIPYIQELAFKSNIQEVECFATTARIANNLLSEDIGEVNSIYSYIYGGSKSNVEDEEEQEQAFENDDMNSILKRVPLKISDNEENALFIVDEAQLLSDSYYRSIDLIFGSGHLLKDFLKFTNLQETKRKIIFIGDPYQMHTGNEDESPMRIDYLDEQYGIKASSFVLLDKPEYSELTKETLKCVNAMKDGMFNSLMFTFGSDLQAIEKSAIVDHIKIMLEFPTKRHVLTYSNEDAHRINLWIKSSILKNGEDIAVNDLVTFHNNIGTQNSEDPFAKPKKIFNGEFATVEEISDQIITESISIKQSPNPILLHFRPLKLKLNTTQEVVEVLSLEDFRTNAKVEMSEEMRIAFIVLLEEQVRLYLKQNPFEVSQEFEMLQQDEHYSYLKKEQIQLEKALDSGEKVKTRIKDLGIEIRKIEKKVKRQHRNKLEYELLSTTSSIFYKYKNAALLRYGWAMTVHRSTAYEFDQVIINMDQGSNRGKNNHAYFQWLYTALGRGKETVKLINYEPISPFSKSELKDAPSGTKSKDVFFHSSENDPQQRLKSFKEFFIAFIKAYGLEIEKIEPLNWQERYYLKQQSGAAAIVNVSYDGKGHFKTPVIMKAEPNEFKEEIAQIFSSKTSMKEFSFASNKWREIPYSVLADKLDTEEITINAVVQNNYHDTLKVSLKEDELEIEFWYGGDGLFSKIIPRYYSSVALWESFKNVIHAIGGDRGHQ